MKYLKLYEQISNYEIEVMTSDEFYDFFTGRYGFHGDYDLISKIKYFNWDDFGNPLFSNSGWTSLSDKGEFFQTFNIVGFSKTKVPSRVSTLISASIASPTLIIQPLLKGSNPCSVLSKSAGYCKVLVDIKYKSFMSLFIK